MRLYSEPWRCSQVFVSGHRRNDLRSLWLHRVIADKLQVNPNFVLGKARANVDKWRSDANLAYYVKEWDALLSGPRARLLKVLMEDTEYATALRHADPFAGVLTPQERWEVYRKFRREEGGIDQGTI